MQAAERRPFLYSYKNKAPALRYRGFFYSQGVIPYVVKFIRLLREIRLMSENLSTGRFTALFLLGLLYVLSDVLDAVSRVIH